VHYVLTDKINLFIRIRICIRRILKVKIHIRRMQILTSFVTSLAIIYTHRHHIGLISPKADAHVTIPQRVGG